MPKLFVYRIVTDAGVAPHVNNNYLTLTICKPGIRSRAAIGDYVLALVALQHTKLTGKNENRFYKAAYLFEITDKVDMREYEAWCKIHAPGKICTEEVFDGDCQYNSELSQRNGPHGPSERNRNISGVASLISNHYAAWTSDRAHTLTDEEIDGIGLNREQVKTATRNYFTVPLSDSRVSALNEIIDGEKPKESASVCREGKSCSKRGGRRTRKIRNGTV